MASMALSDLEVEVPNQAAGIDGAADASLL